MKVRYERANDRRLLIGCRQAGRQTACIGEVSLSIWSRREAKIVNHFQTFFAIKLPERRRQDDDYDDGDDDGHETTNTNNNKQPAGKGEETKHLVWRDTGDDNNEADQRRHLGLFSLLLSLSRLEPFNGLLEMHPFVARLFLFGCPPLACFLPTCCHFATYLLLPGARARSGSRRSSRLAFSGVALGHENNKLLSRPACQSLPIGEEKKGRRRRRRAKEQCASCLLVVDLDTQ